MLLFFFLSFCPRVIRKGLRKNSEIVVNLRRSSGQSMCERSDRWPEFLVFKSVPGCIEGIPGHYGMFGGIMGCSRGVPGLFRAVPGCSGGVPEVFQGVPGVFRGVPGVFRVLQTPYSVNWKSKQCLYSHEDGWTIFCVQTTQCAVPKESKLAWETTLTQSRIVSVTILFLNYFHHFAK